MSSKYWKCWKMKESRYFKLKHYLLKYHPLWLRLGGCERRDQGHLDHREYGSAIHECEWSDSNILQMRRSKSLTFTNAKRHFTNAKHWTSGVRNQQSKPQILGMGHWNSFKIQYTQPDIQSYQNQYSRLN